jgi:hypothetical protein
MHYTGKQHDKKVMQFLANWSRETGEPVPVRLKDGAVSSKKVLFHVAHVTVFNIYSVLNSKYK